MHRNKKCKIILQFKGTSTIFCIF